MIWYLIAGGVFVLMLLSIARDIYWCHRNPEKADLEYALDELRVGIEEMQAAVGDVLLPALERAIDGMNRAIHRLGNYDRKEP